MADAISGVLDALHSYVVAHDLVSEAYLTGERTLAARLLSGTAPTEPAPQATKPDDAAEHAAKNELAIAA